MPPLVPVALGEIDRIEVIRGPNSASYGSNAFLGVINVVTRPAAEKRGAVAELRRPTMRSAP
jgi:iron complex outermembrane receptor protein